MSVTHISVPVGTDKDPQEQSEKAGSSCVKSEFIANMSHDMRTPITGILGLGKRILQMATESISVLNTKTETTTERDEMIDSRLIGIRQDASLLIDSTHELLAVCNEILEITQLESEKTADRVEVFKLERLLQHTIDFLQPFAKNKQLQLSYALDSKIPLCLKGVRLYLDRILLNVVSNALKFTHEGYVKVIATLAEGHEPQRPFQLGQCVTLSITIEDSGIGIPFDKYDFIFEQFSKLNPSYEGVYKGTGLGLYKVKSYIDLLGGKVHVESQIGEGSRFTITVPFAVADAYDSMCVDVGTSSAYTKDIIKQRLRIKKGGHSSAGLRMQNTASTEIQCAKVHILIVEDNAMAAIGLQMTLAPFNCTIDVAEDAIQAISMVQKYHYDLILMDVGLPELSGLEATARIRGLSDVKRAQVPIFAVTGHADSKDKRQACFDVGMQAILGKPVQFVELKSAFETYVLHAKKSAKAQTSPVQKTDDIIDWKACMALCQDDESVLHEMLSALASDLMTAKTQLAQSYAKLDMKAIRAELHRIRGGVCYLKLPELDKCLSDFHEAAKVNCGIAQLQVAYSALERAIVHFQAHWTDVKRD